MDDESIKQHVQVMKDGFKITCRGVSCQRYDDESFIVWATAVEPFAELELLEEQPRRLRPGWQRRLIWLSDTPVLGYLHADPTEVAQLHSELTMTEWAKIQPVTMYREEDNNAAASG